MRFRFIYFFILPFVISCTNDQRAKEVPDTESPRIRKQTSLKLPKINQKYTIGDVISFELTSDLVIDSVLLEAEDHTKTYYENQFIWKSDFSKTGKQRFKVTAFFNGQSETHYPRVTFYSDIEPQNMSYEVINKYPHDKTSYTQGLFFWDNTLYESTGQKGRSSLSKVDLTTGKRLQSVQIDSKYFGEGSTVWKGKIVMLTYVSNIGFVFDTHLKQTDEFHYDHQGWGITTYGDTLLVSDGSEKIHLMDPRDFSEIGLLEVYDNKGPVDSINELEIIRGLLYANIYTKDLILAIDPHSGKVIQRINMAGLLSKMEKEGMDEVNEVLNGIAYNPNTKKTYVTGKHWPALYEVKFIQGETIVQ